MYIDSSKEARRIMSNSQPIYLTAEGKRKMEEELEYLTTVRRREVAQMIAEAKAEGDISENAGYDEAKIVQGFLEGKIRELEATLRLAQVIQESESDAKVSLGKTVVIREVGTKDNETYTIVGSAEADPGNGRISYSSPIGSALMDKKKGDKVKVTPTGNIVIEFEIREIR